MEKTYSIVIQFGDGNPITSSIRAKNGCDAQDKALALHPGARSIHITGVLKEHPAPRKRVQPKAAPKKSETHPLFTDVSHEEVQELIKSSKEQMLDQCQELQQQGLSHRAIARKLNISQSTVQRWLSFTLSH